MKKIATLLYLAMLFASMAFGQFNGLVKEISTHSGDGLDPYKTIRIYASIDDNAQLISINGGGAFPISWIQATGEVYQNPMAGATSLDMVGLNDINAPLVSFDSYLTIGENSILADLGLENMLQLAGPIDSEAFELGVGPLTIGTQTAYAFIGVPEGSIQSIPDENGLVLIAQITTTEDVIGEINVKLLFQGEFVRIDGLNLYGGSGCTDPDAINFDSTAVFKDDSCIYPILGCVDADAINYNSEANTDDGSCQYGGCTDSLALNYDINADVDDGTCVYPVFGCTDETASNYNPLATNDDGTCQIAGCTDSNALNFNENANLDDGSCDYPPVEGCMDENAENYNSLAEIDNGSCIYIGCTDELAVNYNEIASIDDGSCLYGGCTDSLALNYDIDADIDDGTCVFPVFGCTDVSAVNYNPLATNDDGSCLDSGCTDQTALNYDDSADVDDGSCIYPPVEGCLDPEAENFNPEAEVDNGSCLFNGCMNPIAENYDPNANTEDGSCIILGCTNEGALNYSPEANSDNGLCVLSCDDLNMQLSLNNLPAGEIFNICESETPGVFNFLSNIEVNAPEINGLTIFWGDEQFNDFSFTPLEVFHNYDTQGDFEISMTLTSSFGCEKTVHYTVKSMKAPSIDAILSNADTEICANEEFSFNLATWEGNHSSTTYKVFNTNGDASETMSHPLSNDPIPYSFSAPSCSSTAYDGTPFAYGIKIEADNACGTSSSILPAMRVSGAMINAEASFFNSNEATIACEEEVFNFVNTSNGFVIASEEGCINNNLATWRVIPDNGWMVESGDLNNSEFIGLRFTEANDYVIELSENEICATTTANQDIQIIHAAGIISGVVNLNELALENMEVAAFKWSDEAGEFIHSETTVTDNSGQFNLNLTEGNYQVKVVPNQEDQAGIIPMYTNEVWKWGLAEIFEVGCMNQFDSQIDLQQAQNNGLNIVVAGGVYYRDQFKSMQGDPIPGIPIIIEKDTAENQAVAAGITDLLGNYIFDNLPPGNYRMHVDMPGLPMAETHHFTVGLDGIELGGLNFFADSLDQIYISDAVNIIESPSSNQSPAKVYPNPTSGLITLEIEGEDLSLWDLIVVDALGRRIVINTSLKKSRWQIDFSKLESGFYYYRMSKGNETRTGKILKH